MALGPWTFCRRPISYNQKTVLKYDKGNENLQSSNVITELQSENNLQGYVNRENQHFLATRLKTFEVVYQV